MKNKKGIELSINFLVTLILAITIFSFGIIFARNLIGGASELTELTDSDLDKRIGELLCSGNERVCYGIRDKTIRRGEFDIFGVRILNVLNQGDVEFTITVSDTGIIPKGKKVIQDVPDPRLNILPRTRTETIANNEDESFGIGIEVPKNAAPGRYILDIAVTYGTEQYDFSKLYVTVP